MSMIRGNICLISGGLSGLGKATVERIVDLGGKVIICDISKNDGSFVRRLGEKNAYFCKTDVSKEEDVKNALQLGMNHFKEKQLRICINCAGIATAMKTVSKGEPHNLEIFQKVMNVNAIGTFNVSRLCAALMSKQELSKLNGECGIIINTASIAGYEGQIGQIAYAASKASIIGMTLPMARDLSSHCIRVNAIAPGIFQTPLLAKLPEKVQNELGKTVPFPSRLGHPEDFAALAQHIIENPMINGEVIRLDGALRMPPK